jgi:hypothetical protein
MKFILSPLFQVIGVVTLNPEAAAASCMTAKAVDVPTIGIASIL